ncbi:MAG: GspE/PulE family protein [Mariprofundales bacterium]
MASRQNKRIKLVFSDEAQLEFTNTDYDNENWVLVRDFRPMQEEIAVKQFGKVHIFPLTSIRRIVFLPINNHFKKNETNTQDESIQDCLPGEQVEWVLCDDEQHCYVRVMQRQPWEHLGFFGIPLDGSAERIFFNQYMVRCRELDERIGEILIAKGLASSNDVVAALKQQESHKRLGDILISQGTTIRSDVERIAHAQTASDENHKLGKLLIEAGLVDETQVQQALDMQSGVRKPLGQLLVESGLISEKELLTALAVKFRLPFVDINDIDISPEAMEVVGFDLAKKLQALPLNIQDSGILVATSNPVDVRIGDEMRFRTGKNIRMVVATRDQIDHELMQYEADISGDSDAEIDFESMLHDEDSEDEDEEDEGYTLAADAEQKPVIRLVNKIVTDALHKHASDIHIRPLANCLLVSFRINGMLMLQHRLRLDIHPALISRFKVVANMDISEHRLPQDGRFKAALGTKKVELRVSCMPGLYGEHLVLRILSGMGGLRGIDTLGLRDNETAQMRHLISYSYGMILITGPTGSGKSTTLLSLMSTLTAEPKHLLSLEDPVEADIPGVNQIPINENIGFGFAEALRNVLRHDPDIIMIGEVRDGKTAAISVQAALTGHLLLASLHTNTAAGSFGRLVNMGVEPYLVAATVIGVTAQRLLPRVCKKCSKRQELSESDMKFITDAGFSSKDLYDYEADGCESCHQTGISGRVLIYELLIMDETLRKLVTNDASEAQVHKVACENGMRSLAGCAIDTLREGTTAWKYVLPMLMK